MDKYHKGINMKLVSLLVTALLLSTSLTTSVSAQKQPTGVMYDFPVTRVLDGDTVAFSAPFLPQPLKQELSIRVYGVDTPEKGFRAKCPQEDQRGQAASQFTKNAVASAKVRKVVIMDWDKFGGRVLGDVVLDGKSLREMLIVNGFARPYFGEAKGSWC
jgi:endonuclease YncB( thermonuclease family)